MLLQVHDACIQLDGGLFVGASVGESSCEACAETGDILPGCSQGILRAFGVWQEHRH